MVHMDVPRVPEAPAGLTRALAEGIAKRGRRLKMDSTLLAGIRALVADLGYGQKVPAKPASWGREELLALCLLRRRDMAVEFVSDCWGNVVPDRHGTYRIVVGQPTACPLGCLLEGLSCSDMAGFRRDPMRQLSLDAARHLGRDTNYVAGFVEGFDQRTDGGGEGEYGPGYEDGAWVQGQLRALRIPIDGRIEARL